MIMIINLILMDIELIWIPTLVMILNSKKNLLKNLKNFHKIIN